MKIDLSQLVTAEQKANSALVAARLVAQARLLAGIEGFSARAAGDVPLAEKLSWGAKEAAARAVLGGAANDADRALLEGEAQVTGEDAAGLAARIVRNADSYRGLVAMLTGLRRGAEAAISAARTPAEAEAVAEAALARLAEAESGD